MSHPYARGSRALGICDVCGLRERLRKLRPLIVKRQMTQTMACPRCWVPDQPQLFVGERPVIDAEALRNPRPDQYAQSREITAPAVMRTPISSGVIDVIAPLGGEIVDGQG